MIDQTLRQLMRHGLTATPVVLDRLLGGAKPDWDRRPDPERFTLREVLAHLADLEAVWRQRVEAIVREPGCAIQGQDPGEVAKRNDYAAQDPRANLTRFSEGRAALVATLDGLDEADWAKAGKHSYLGPITVDQIAQFMVGHDAYHVRQISEWLGA